MNGHGIHVRDDYDTFRIFLLIMVLFILLVILLKYIL